MRIAEISSNPPFQLVAGHPALDFVNTLDWRFRESGTEELLHTYDDLLRFTAQSQLLTPRQAQQLQRAVGSRSGARVLESSTELRESLAQVSYAVLDGQSPSATTLRTLDRHFKAARHNQRLSWNRPHFEWGLSGLESKAELPLWLLSLAASDLMTGEAMRMVRACGNTECRWLFLDTSKNHSRRWCDMKLCGNRMKARRFKAQHAT
jgi:predicted RNA-binding Zn ribbon-like protein